VTSKRRASLFRTREVKRLVSVAQATGLTVTGIEYAPDGTLRVLTGQKGHGTVDSNPVDQWMNRHAS
jgi:hypothetical protein